MKSKVIGLVAVIFLLLFGVYAEAYFVDGKNYRYHQHLEDQKQETCDATSAFCTHLPLVVIDTQEIEIPGKPIVDENDHHLGFTTTATGEDMLQVQVSIIDQETMNHLEDEPTFTTQSLIRARGRSSRYFEKNSYLLRFLEEDGTYGKREVMGMDPHYEWVLYGPYLDKSLIRNYLWFNVSGEIMDYAPNVRFCELILNGEYQGLYVMSETITSGKDSRLDLKESLEDFNRSGYIFRIDELSDDPIKNLETFLKYSKRSVRPENIVYPRSGSLNEDLVRFIEQEISDFEKALYSFDYDSKDYGYSSWIDVNSFVDYFIISEFTMNNDVGSLSTYMAKDIGGKYQMIVWDFNNSCQNFEVIQDKEKFLMIDINWYKMLMKDEIFVQRIIDRYHELRQGVLSEDYLFHYIDETLAYLGPAIDRNFEVWKDSLDRNFLEPVQRNPKTHEQAVDQLKQFIVERGRWMDEHIEILLQYCHESKVKKFNH